MLVRVYSFLTIFGAILLRLISSALAGSLIQRAVYLNNRRFCCQARRHASKTKDSIGAGHHLTSAVLSCIQTSLYYNRLVYYRY